MTEKTYWLTLVDATGRMENTIVYADSLASAEKDALKYAKEMHGWRQLRSVRVSKKLTKPGRELWDGSVV